jgi:hypothetical protein
LFAVSKCFDFVDSQFLQIADEYESLYEILLSIESGLILFLQLGIVILD